MTDLFTHDANDIDDDSPDSSIDIGAELDESLGIGLDQSVHFFDPLEFDTLMADVPDHLHTYDPANQYVDVSGDPGVHVNYWDQQQFDDTCAVAAQINILEHYFPGQHFDEAMIRDIAAQAGWFHNGTAPQDVGKILELHGIPVNHIYDASVDDLEAILDSGQHVIVGVHGSTIWDAPDDSWLDRVISSIPGIPGQQENGPDHAVQVIGVVTDQDGEKFVVLNDPGVDFGQGLKVPVDQFEDAWSGFTMYTDGPTYDPAPQEWSAWPMLGGYYNADGTYHWTSDNTDRDPETGSIVRRW